MDNDPTQTLSSLVESDAEPLSVSNPDLDTTHGHVSSSQNLVQAQGGRSVEHLNEDLQRLIMDSTTIEDPPQNLDGVTYTQTEHHQSLHIGDKHTHTSGPVYNAPIVIQRPVVIIHKDPSTPNAPRCSPPSRSAFMTTCEETTPKIPVHQTESSPSHRPQCEEQLVSDDSMGKVKRDTCEELKSSLNEKVNKLASEASSLAEFSQRPITPVNLSIVSKLQPVEDESQQKAQKELVDKGESQTQTEVAPEHLFERAKDAAKQEADRKFHSDQVNSKADYIEKHGNVVGVVGQAGIGKTASSKKWALQALRGQLYGKMSYIFYVVVRFIDFTKETTLLQLLLSTMLADWICTSDEAQTIINAINNDLNVLIIFDGLDKAAFESFSTTVPLLTLYSKTRAENFLKNLIAGNLLPRAKKIFTSRADQLFNLHPSYRPVFIVQILGLNPNSQNELGRQICGPKYDAIQKQIQQNSNVEAFCHVPVNFVLTLNYLLNQSENIQFVSLSRLLTFNCTQYARTEHLKEQNLNLDKLAKLAWTGFKDRKAFFNADDLHSAGIDNADAFLNTAVTEQVNLKLTILECDKRRYFSQFIWHEFFSAVYLMMLMPLRKFKNHYKQLDSVRWQGVAKFAFGICDSKVFSELQRFVSGCTGKDLKLKKAMLREMMLSALKREKDGALMKRVWTWTHEANDKEITSSVASSLTLRIDRCFAELLPIDVVNLCYILQAGVAKKVKRLNLSWNLVGDLGATAIARCVHKVKELVLCHCDIEGGGVAELSKRIRVLTKPLDSLDLSWNKIRDLGLTSVASCIHNTKILILSHAEIGCTGLDELAEKIRCLPNPLKKLDLSWNKIGDAGATSLAVCVHNVEDLQLSDCDIGSIGIINLANGIRSSKRPMERLNLACNTTAGDECAESLALCSRNVKVLYVSWCGLSEEGKNTVASNSRWRVVL